MTDNRQSGSDGLFNSRAEAWTILRKGFNTVFNQNELDTISRAERTFQKDRRKIAFLTFENRLASLGGLAAVMALLPSNLVDSGEDVIIVTPFYNNNPKVKNEVAAGKFQEIFKNEKFNLCGYSGVVSCYRDTGCNLPAFHIGVQNQFTAVSNPYAYSKDEKLVMDALVFSAAVPFVMNKLGFKRNILFHAQDWETAPVAITSKFALLSGLLEHARTVLTLHNSFDGPLSKEKKRLFFGNNLPGHTVLQCAIPLLNGPLTTVSSPFARELTNDPLQCTVFTNHLQKLFKSNPPLGIENGLFGDHSHPFTANGELQALNGNCDLLVKEKERFRENLEKIIGTETNPDIIGLLHFKSKSSKEPIFFMSGRLDLMQKGFDVIFHAFKKLPRGKAKLFFCPSGVGENIEKELAFFKKIQIECSGDITIWPFRIPSEDYREVLRGSSFLVMPSFYEPFGAATEGFLHGTPVIARATGGLLVQVKSCSKVPLSGGGNRADFFRKSTGPTGILFREECDQMDAKNGWRECLNQSPDRRIKIKSYRAMVNAAENALKKAIEIHHDKTVYGNMICNGIQSLENFSWNYAVEKYKTIYDTASLRGFF